MAKEQKFREHFMDPNGIDKVPFYFTGNGTDFVHAPIFCLEGPNPEADRLEAKALWEAGKKAKVKVDSRVVLSRVGEHPKPLIKSDT